MAKILAFSGSPREKGHSRALLDELVRGAQSKGGEVKVYDLNHPEFRGCQGCFYCRTHPECSVKDYLTPAYGEMADAAGIVFTSPIYFAQITGQAKMWIDRMFPMLDGQSFQPRHPGKKSVAIFAQGDANLERFAAAVNMVQGFMRTFGWHLQDILVCAGASTPGFAIPDTLMKRAFAAGADLAGGDEKIV